jgi:hypothetical protein
MPSSIPETSEAVSRAIITPRETGQILDLAENSVYGLAAAGRIPTIRTSDGRLVGFLRADILPLVGGLWRKKPGIRRGTVRKAKS